jgi:signal transduction histidine kinase/CheY-like chemotaxis protein
MDGTQAPLETFDWKSSAFGPRERWPESLSIAAGICAESRFPMILFWGEDLIQFYNDAYVPILGDKHPGAFGQSARECWSEIWDQVGPMLHTVLHDGAATWSNDLLLPIETAGVRRERYFTFSYSPIRDGDAVAGVFCAVTETTERILREREAQQRTEALEKLNALKTDFFDNVSHEFRTPLALMLGPVEAALERISDEAARLELETALRNGVRLQKLIDTLLDFSRIESGRLAPDFEAVDLAALTADLASAFRSSIERAGLHFEVVCEPSPGPVLVDPSMWEKIVFNLLSNAFKFTLAGGIRLSLSSAANRIVLEVADTGSGIPAEELPNLFRRFHRVPGTPARTHEGSGIGLALVTELVELHGGSIEVESEPGAGSTFRVLLPAREPEKRSTAGRPAPKAFEPFRLEVESWLNPSLPVPSPDGRGSGKRILIVDDNADLRAYLVRVLGAHWQVSTAADGAQALEMTRRDRPDLIVTDVMMPHMDGFELVRRLRADPRTRELPVIVLTARAETRAQLDGSEVGVDEYIVKPFRSHELVARVRSKLDLAELRARARRDESFLLEASRKLASSIDAATTLREVAGVALPDRADWCEVAVIGDDGRFAVAAAAHADPLLDPIAKRAIGREVIPAAAAVARSGVPAIFGDLAAHSIEAVTGRGQEPWYRELGLVSCAIVPMMARGKPIGAINLFFGHSGRHYREADLSVIEELGRRAAAAYENALLYDAERRNALRNAYVADRLQQIFLPGSLPQPQGYELDAVYRPAESDVTIGGDWYTALRLTERLVLFGIGDVVGHGVGAAATMARCRQSIITAAANVLGDPAEVLQRVNRVMLLQGSLVTANVGILDTVTGAISFSSAGHPPPLIVSASHVTRLLPIGGPALGLTQDPAYVNAQARLEPGETLVLYTDGLVELDRDIRAGERELARQLSGQRFATALRKAGRLVGDMLESRKAIDDIAVLTISRRADDGFDQTLTEVHEIRLLREKLRAVLLDCSTPEPRISDAELVLTELCSNSFRHAGGPVRVRLRAEPPGARLEVIDNGPPFAVAAGLPADESAGGRGLFLVAALASPFEVRRTDAGENYATAVLSIS